MPTLMHNLARRRSCPPMCGAKVAIPYAESLASAVLMVLLVLSAHVRRKPPQHRGVTAIFANRRAPMAADLASLLYSTEGGPAGGMPLALQVPPQLGVSGGQNFAEHWVSVWPLRANLARRLQRSVLASRALQLLLPTLPAWQPYLQKRPRPRRSGHHPASCKRTQTTNPWRGHISCPPQARSAALWPPAAT